jgi:hypothetical protein
MENDDMMNITIDGKTIDEVGAEIDARVAADKTLRKEARKQRRHKARGYDTMLIQRDSAISRTNKMVRVSNDLLLDIENYFQALDDNASNIKMQDLRRKIFDSVDDMDYAIGGGA